MKFNVDLEKTKTTELTESKVTKRLSVRKAHLENEIMNRRLPWRKASEDECCNKRAEMNMDSESPNKPGDKGKRRWPTNPKCWRCGYRGHMKDFCPNSKCYFCWRYGHIKKNCLYFLLLQLQKPERTRKNPSVKPVPNIEARLENVHLMPTNKKEEYIVYDREWPLGVYIGPTSKTSDLRRSFNVPPDNLEIKARKSIPVKKIEANMHQNLLCQCVCNGEVYFKEDFKQHSLKNHGGYVLRGSHFNLLPIRNWVNWYDEDDFLKLCYDEEEDYWEYYSNFNK